MHNHLRWEIDFGISSVNVNELIRFADQLFFVCFHIQNEARICKINGAQNPSETHTHARALTTRFTLENSQLAKFFVARTYRTYKYTKTRARPCMYCACMPSYGMATTE